MATVGELLHTAPVLCGDEERREREILLCAALDKPRSYLFAWPEAEVPVEEEQRFRCWLQQRADGLPLAYLLGEREFWSLRLRVDDSTLIPRPETELLVELALALALPADARALDLGTGSGAIALALASERGDWSVTAVDSSAAALATARDNGRQMRAPVNWLLGSWFESIKDQRFDLVVSNPPYLAASDPHLQLGDLRFEPGSALIAGETGLEDLRHIIKASPHHLTPGGWLLLEHGCEQGGAVADLLRERGFAQVHTHADLAGLPRASVARWPEGL